MQVIVFGAHDAPRERLALSYTSRRDPPESGPKQTGPLMLTVFHRTTKDAAAEIIQGGFRDITGRYLTDREGRAFGFPIGHSTTAKAPADLAPGRAWHKLTNAWRQSQNWKGA